MSVESLACLLSKIGNDVTISHNRNSDDKDFTIYFDSSGRGTVAPDVEEGAYDIEHQICTGAIHVIDGSGVSWQFDRRIGEFQQVIV